MVREHNEHMAKLWTLFRDRHAIKAKISTQGI